MLKTTMTHPGILAALAGAGHGSTVLIADGNYPVGTKTYEGAALEYLNLCPGSPTVTDVLKVVAETIPIEAAAVMQPAEGAEPPIFQEFRQILPAVELDRLDRFNFYDTASEPDLCLAIGTGEQRVYANILLTIGVVPPG